MVWGGFCIVGGYFMKVGAIGYNYRHEDDFIKDNSNGCGAYLILLIKEAAVFVIDGKEEEVKKNSFILFDPYIPHSYRGKTNVYQDDWIYLDMKKDEEKVFNDLEIPIDKVVALENLEELSGIVKHMAYEHYSTVENHEEIEKNYFNIFLLKLSTAIKNTEYKQGMSGTKQEKLMHIRNSFHGDPCNVLEIDELAKSLGMSRSGFVHLYKKTFGISVMQDRINGRMDYAALLLRTTNKNIKEIAISCGYSDEYGFIKRFKSFYGKTPTEFRNMI